MLYSRAHTTAERPPRNSGMPCVCPDSQAAVSLFSRSSPYCACSGSTPPCTNRLLHTAPGLMCVTRAEAHKLGMPGCRSGTCQLYL